MITENCNKWFQAQEAEILGELSEFLRFRSVSSESESRQDCLDCAAWLLRYLRRIGIKDTVLIETRGLPVLKASYRCPGATETILYYGHYDVYEAGDLAIWASDPFKPEMRNGRIYARGAQDNKGQTFYFLTALQYLIKTGQLGVNVEILLDGEEETTTSLGLRSLLPRLEQECRADLLMICDTDSVSSDCATIILGLRGIISMTLEYRAARGEVHSGFGGSVFNCANLLSKALADLFDQDGRVALPDYLGEVLSADAIEAELVPKQVAMAVKYSEQKTGDVVSEAELLQGMVARGFKPSIDVSGIQVGTVDEAVRTIIPDLARVQITSRLVPNQNPVRCLEILKKHFESYQRPGVLLNILNQTEGSAGIRFSAESPYVQCASKILERVTGNQPLYDWEGSSIPFVSWAVPKIAPEALIVGFGLEQDAVHSANESFELNQFKKGFAYCCELLIAIAKGSK